MSVSVNEPHAQGILLLTLPNCIVSTPTGGSQKGTLALQCVTIPSTPMPDRDVWLVLKLNAFEMIISPTQIINFDRSTHTYMFLPEDEHTGLVQLTVPPDPVNPGSYEDLETLEVVLSQYGIVHDMGDATIYEKMTSSNLKPTSSATSETASHTEPSELKGRLVLMDENNGEIVATLDDAVPLKEDNRLTAYGHEKDPVVVDLPGEDELTGRREAYVHPVSTEERDLLMRTAGLISRGIILATSAVASGMTLASHYYISHSNPTSKPVEFSPSTRANMRRIHRISGKAVTVTEKTTETIMKTVDHVVGKLSGQSRRSAPGSHAFQSQVVPPPPPPRSGSPASGHSGTASSVYGTPSKRHGTAPIGMGTPLVGPPSRSQRRHGLLNRLLACTDLLLTTIEHSAKNLIESGTDAVSASLAHKYGQDAGEASRLTGQSVRNVGLVYIDLRGVARRALLKRAGKAVVKARMGGRDVMLGANVHAMPPSASVQ